MIDFVNGDYVTEGTELDFIESVDLPESEYYIEYLGNGEIAVDLSQNALDYFESCAVADELFGEVVEESTDDILVDLINSL